MPPKSKLSDDKLEQIAALLRAGVHPERAFIAAGLGESTYRWLKLKAREGSRKHIAIIDKLEEAVAMGEAQDVITTRRAATVDKGEIPCEKCGHVMSVDPATLLAWGRQVAMSQSIKSTAAQAAFQRLMLRFPGRWSPRVTHTIEEQHEEFLGCAQRVLEPEVFERLLTAYVALREGSTETGGDPEPEAPESVH